MSMFAYYNQMMKDINAVAFNVKDVSYSESEEKWIVTYKNGIEPDRFDNFIDVIFYIYTESQGE